VLLLSWGTAGKLCRFVLRIPFSDGMVSRETSVCFAGIFVCAHHTRKGSQKQGIIPFPTQFSRATGTGDHRSPLQRYETLQRLRSSLLKKKKRQGGQGPPGLADSTEFTASKQGGRKDARNASVPNFYERTKPQTRVWARRPSAGRGEVGVQRESRGDRCAPAVGDCSGTFAVRSTPPRFPLARAERCSEKQPPCQWGQSLSHLR
jgi:hypothetical protein